MINSGNGICGIEIFKLSKMPLILSLIQSIGALTVFLMPSHMLAIVLLTLLNMSETIPVRLDQPLEIAFFPSFTLELIVLVIPFQRFKAVF